MRRAITATIVLLGCAASASAQSRFTVSAGASWIGSSDLGSAAATLRRNEPGTTTPGSFTLFAVDTSLERAVGVSARFGVALTESFEIEAVGTFERPRLAARISDDAEADAVVLPDQRIAQFTAGANVIWSLPGFDRSARVSPYAFGGASYLRQIDDNRTLAETGTVGHVGGGLRYWLRGNRTTRRALGLRAEAALQLRTGGFDFDDKTRVAPAVHLLGTFGF